MINGIPKRLEIKSTPNNDQKRISNKETQVVALLSFALKKRQRVVDCLKVETFLISRKNVLRNFDC